MEDEGGIGFGQKLGWFREQEEQALEGHVWEIGLLQFCQGSREDSLAENEDAGGGDGGVFGGLFPRLQS